MKCRECREVVSAALDGQASEVELARSRAHMSGCGSCRAFAESVAGLHRETRLSAAPVVPDLTAWILLAIGAERVGSEGSRAWPLRVILAVVAALEIGAAMPALLLGDDAGLSAHAARHAGSFALALGVGFLYAAWRPRRSAALLVVAGALVACLTLASVLDVLSGRTAALSEAAHIPELIGLVAAWLLVRETSDDDRVAI
jgi:predicted anti-sigma-YlaC factor YlaD